MSDTTDDSVDTPSADTATGQPVVGKPFLAAMAAIMAVPALVPLLVLVEPSLVPFLPAVDSGDGGMVVFMVVISAVMLAANWAFLYAIYRWLNKYGGQP